MNDTDSNNVHNLLFENASDDDSTNICKLNATINYILSTSHLKDLYYQSVKGWVITEEGFSTCQSCIQTRLEENCEKNKKISFLMKANGESRPLILQTFKVLLYEIVAIVKRMLKTKVKTSL